MHKQGSRDLGLREEPSGAGDEGMSRTRTQLNKHFDILFSTYQTKGVSLTLWPCHLH
jgi:hypothetical protein